MEATFTKPIESPAHDIRNGGLLKWQWITLLVILAYEGAGCLVGGVMLMLTPDGSSMQMPVEIMHNVFADFLIPGIILFGLGIINSLAFIHLKVRSRYDWLYTALGMGGLAIWFLVEIAILGELHWLHAMWGLPVLAGVLLCIPMVHAKENLRPAFLLNCGIASSLLYAYITLIVPLFWLTYDSSSQTISELSAIGAPTRLLWIILCLPYSLLSMAFGWGIWKAAWNKKLRIAGALFLLYGTLGFLWYLFPMHSRETLAAGGGTWSDTGHLALAGITQLIFLLCMYFASAGLDRGFRIYSLLTFLALAAFGLLTFLKSPGVSLNEPTPLLGIWERINIGLFMVWVIVLALHMNRKADTVNA